MKDLSGAEGVGGRRIARGAPQKEVRTAIEKLSSHHPTANTVRYLMAAGKGYVDLMEEHGMDRKDVMADLQKSKLIGSSLELLNTHGRESGIIERDITHKDLMAFILRSKRTRRREKRKVHKK